MCFKSPPAHGTSILLVSLSPLFCTGSSLCLLSLVCSSFTCPSTRFLPHLIPCHCFASVLFSVYCLVSLTYQRLLSLSLVQLDKPFWKHNVLILVFVSSYCLVWSSSSSRLDLSYHFSCQVVFLSFLRIGPPSFHLLFRLSSFHSHSFIFLKQISNNSRMKPTKFNFNV